MRFRCSISAVLGAIALFLSATSSRAQDLRPEIPPAHLALVEGEASLLRGRERDLVGSGTPLVPGDVLRTDRGRANVLFPGGSALDLDEFTTVEFLSPSRLRLTEGRVILTTTADSVPGLAEYSIDTNGSGFVARTAGEYRVSLVATRGGLQTELAVIRGDGLLWTTRGEMPVHTSQRSVAFSDGLPTYPQTFYSTRIDPFEEWSAMLRDERTGSRSSGYLPSDIRAYGSTFDRNGSWSYEPSYGNVWYPNVAPGWGPYQDGFWDPLPAYGWTWVGAGAWAWPTHHYGRWGYRSNRWFWIPGPVWSPAWVAWGSAPGYVSWGPLGYNNQPVFGLSVYAGYPAFGWTVVASNSFYRPHSGWQGRRVTGIAPPRGIAFASHRSAPIDLPRAMPRGVSTVPSGRTRAGGAVISPRNVPGGVTSSSRSSLGSSPSPRSTAPTQSVGRSRSAGPAGPVAEPRSRMARPGVASAPAARQPASPSREGVTRAVPRNGGSVATPGRWSTSAPNSGGDAGTVGTPGASSSATAPLPPRPEPSARTSRRVQTAPPVPAPAQADQPQRDSRRSAYARPAPASPAQTADQPARAVPRSSAGARGDRAERAASPAQSGGASRGGRLPSTSLRQPRAVSRGSR